MGTIQLIVECTIDREREKLISRIGRLKYRLPFMNAYVVEVSEKLAWQLEGVEGVKEIYANAHITAQMEEARKEVKADEVVEKGITGKGVAIAILDTGVARVEDLVKPRNRIVAFKDFVKGRTEAYDDNGHGTHVGSRRA